MLYRVEAAMPTDYGSTLQAYCRDQVGRQVIKTRDPSEYYAPPFRDGGITGSEIALFGSPRQIPLRQSGKLKWLKDYLIP
ncbi:MAG: hypothetical protein R2744_13515 [Bacteroidales bacterium]